MAYETYLANGPWKKSLNGLLSPTKYVIPKSLKPVSHWPSKEIRLPEYTPWKINMEPINHPFRKENDLPNLHDYVPC